MTIAAFTPTAVPELELVERTVGRASVIDRILDRLRAAATSDNRPHVLVVGSRGSGKTHLLRVVSHLARKESELAQRLRFVTLPEDSPEIVSYADLLYAIVEHLGAQNAGDGGGLVLSARDVRNDATQLQRLILDAVEGQVLVLVVENLNRLLNDFGEDGQQRFRAFVETSGAVVLLASTPLLSRDLSDHATPWYGAFHPEHLEELSLEEGTELLKRLAVDSHNPDLAEFLDTDEGRGRLEAVRQLTGGSPRMWIVLAGAMTIENLDALVPVVRALLDELVPYYQERLNSLAGNERKIIVELCRTTEVGADGHVRAVASGLRNVTDLAKSAGLDRQVVATTLGRLEERGWVRRVKVPGTDGRTSWYEVREPLLRHHLQYRDTRGTLLEMVVDFLRAWYAPWEQRLRLAAVQPGTTAERYLSSVLVSNRFAQQSDALWADDQLNSLLVAARASIDTEDAGGARGSTHSRLAAVLAEVAALAAKDGDEAAAEAARTRLDGTSESDRAVIQRAANAMLDARLDSELSGPEEVCGRLAAGAEACTDASLRDRVAVVLLAAGWRARIGDRHAAVEAIKALEAQIPAAERALRLSVASELAVVEWAPDSDERRAALAAVSEAQAALLGPEHPDTLLSRERVAVALEANGDPAGAASLLDELVTPYARTFGGHEPRTLGVRAEQARAHSAAGDHHRALDLFTGLAHDATDALARDDEQLFDIWLHVVEETAEIHGPEAAASLENDVIRELISNLGPTAALTIDVRQRHASRLAELQRFDEAAAAFSALADDLAMDVGSYDVRALNARAGAALATALGGDAGGAMAIVAEMPPVDAVTGAIDARTEFRLARFVLFVTLERKLETLDEANAVLDLADAGATLDAELVRTIAWARISTASKLGDMREAIRYALDLHERETAAGIATESSAGITFLANLATVGDFDVWGFGTTDELLRDARRKVVEAEPRLAVFGWLHHTLTLPVARVRNAIAAIFVELEANREASRSVFSALLTAASSGVVTPQETRAWRAAWADVPLPSGVDAATLSAFADALIAAREGSREELAKLPSEVRAALESAIARAPEDDQHFVGPVLSEPSSD